MVKHIPDSKSVLKIMQKIEATAFATIIGENLS